MSNNYSRYNNKKSSNGGGSGYKKKSSKSKERDPLKLGGRFTKNDSDNDAAPQYRGLVFITPELVDHLIEHGPSEEYGNWALSAGLWVRKEDGETVLSLSGNLYIPEEEGKKTTKKTSKRKPAELDEDEDDDDEI
jgi:hypothetical protein